MSSGPNTSSAPAVTSEPKPRVRPRVEVAVLREGAVAPSYQTELAAGLDLSFCPDEAPFLEIKPGEIVLAPCGIAIAIPAGYEGQVRPRSGLSVKHGISMPNAPGTVDADYRGEIKVPLINLGRRTFRIEPGMRIAQMVIAPVAHAHVEIVDALGATARGSGGFGSTGV